MKEVTRKENGEAKPAASARGIRDGLPYLLAGGAIGTTLALLFAPKKGTELRSDIAEKTRSGLDTTLEKARHLKDQSAEALQTVRERAGSVYDFAAAKFTFDQATDEEAASTPPSGPMIEPELVNGETDLSAKHAKAGRKASNIL